MVPLLLLIVLLGVYPKPFIDRVAASAEVLSERITQVAEGQAASRPENLSMRERAVTRVGGR